MSMVSSATVLLNWGQREQLPLIYFEHVFVECVCVCVRVCARVHAHVYAQVCHGMSVEVRGQLVQAGSLHPRA